MSKKAQKIEITRLFLVNNSHEKCHKIKFVIFYFPILPQIFTKMFESLRNEKKKEEISEGIVSEMTEEKSASDLVEAGSEPAQEAQNTQAPPQPASQTEIGIGNLKDKRVKLEEAVDYVGLLIANLKEKRTRLEKEVEEESVDIKNLRAKLSINDAPLDPILSQSPAKGLAKKSASPITLPLINLIGSSKYPLTTVNKPFIVFIRILSWIRTKLTIR